MSATRIIKEIDYLLFKEQIENKNVIVNPHALFRLSEAQRKVYKEDELIETLSKEKPIFIGLQQNNRYAAFYSRKLGFLRIMFSIGKEIEIITFTIQDNIPKI